MTLDLELKICSSCKVNHHGSCSNKDDRRYCCCWRLPGGVFRKLEVQNARTRNQEQTRNETPTESSPS